MICAGFDVNACQRADTDTATCNLAIRVRVKLTPPLQPPGGLLPMSIAYCLKRIAPIAAILAASIVSGGTQSASAQTDVFPKEIIALFDDINDIDKMRVLNPLKLTGDQLDKLIAAMKKAQDDYNKKLSDAAVPPIRALAADI